MFQYRAIGKVRSLVNQSLSSSIAFTPKPGILNDCGRSPGLPELDCLPTPIRDSGCVDRACLSGLQLRGQPPIFTGFPFNPGCLIDLRKPKSVQSKVIFLFKTNSNFFTPLGHEANLLPSSYRDLELHLLT